jgi:DNA-binding MarR family transcriptional regulator
LQQPSKHGEPKIQVKAMATPADKDQPEIRPPHDAGPAHEGHENHEGRENHKSHGVPEHREGPITDEEYSDLGRTMGMLLHRIMRARQESDGGGTAVLAMLSKCGPVRASDLARELFLDLSTVSRHVQHLERDGLIERAPDPSDRRATTLHLTGLGEKHIDDFWQRRIDAMRDGLGHWDPQEMRTLITLMHRYVEDYIGILGKGPGTDGS